MPVRIILEGGESDTERHELDAEGPPAFWLSRGEQYEPVLSHFDEHLRDVGGAWRYRIVVDWQEMRPGHSAIRVKP